MSKLPAEFVSDYKAKAVGTKVCDIPIEELDRDELLATIGAIQVQYGLEMSLQDRRREFEEARSRCQRETLRHHGIIY